MTSVGVMASAVVTSTGPFLGSGSAGSSLTVVINLIQAIQVGDLVVVRVAADNVIATAPTFTCADSGGNTYTSHAFAGRGSTAGAGVVGGILASKATNPVSVGGTITVSLSNAVTMRAAFAERYPNHANTLRNTAVTAVGNTTAASVTSGSATAGDLVIGAVAIESWTAPSAYDTDNTGGDWTAGVVIPSTTSGNDNLAVEIVGQTKLVTAPGAQTYNLTNVATDWVALIAIFTP